MGRYPYFLVTLVLAIAVLISGCVRHEPLKGRPSDSTEELPNWAFNPNGFKVAVQGVANSLSVSVNSVVGTPQVICEGGCAPSTRVATLIVGRDEVISALSSTGSISRFSLINNFSVTTEGHFPSFTFAYGNDCEPIVFALTDQATPASFSLTRQELAQGSRLIFLPGDATLDGRVDEADQKIFLNPVVKENYSWSDGDFNGDNRVGSDDALCLIANFGTTLY